MYNDVRKTRIVCRDRKYINGTICSWCWALESDIDFDAVVLR